jgi:hypothetical protein
MWNLFIRNRKFLRIYFNLHICLIMDGPGLNFLGAKIFPPVQTDPGAHPAHFSMGNASIFREKLAGSWCLNMRLRLEPRLEKK